MLAALGCYGHGCVATVYDYVGCFDKNDVGVDQEKKEMGEDWFQTTAHCIAYCNYMNYPYAGIGEDERKLKYIYSHFAY